MAIEILKRERNALRRKAKQFNSRHWKDGRWDGVVSVRAYNCLRDAAKLTIAILALHHAGL